MVLPFVSFGNTYMKIVIGVNTLTAIDRIAYSNHCQLWFRLGRNHPEIDFIFNAPHRMSIDRMRNMTARIALDNNADYIMFLDDDVIVPMDCVKKMIAADKDIVAGWTIIRGYPFNNMFFKYVNGDKTQLNYYNEVDVSAGPVVDVDAVGFSCVLIKVDLLRKIPQPFFVTGPFNTEDVYFCLKAREFVPDCTISVDTSLETGHVMDTEVVEPRTKGEFRTFYETAYKASQEEPQKDRGDSYLAKVKELA